MDVLFLLDADAPSALYAQDATVQLSVQPETVLLLAQPETALLLSADPAPYLFDALSADPGSGTGCPACNEVFKVLFTYAGDVLLLSDGRVATGRY